METKKVGFFEEQMERLRANRNWAQAFSDLGRLQRIKNLTRGVAPKVLEEAISLVLGEHKLAPTDQEILQAVIVCRGTDRVAAQTSLACEGCRDKGWSFIGDQATRCVCAAGGKVGEEELAEHQRWYEKGRTLFAEKKSIMPGLPYNPKERMA
jgi:hypothetical protein